MNGRRQLHVLGTGTDWHKSRKPQHGAPNRCIHRLRPILARPEIIRAHHAETTMPSTRSVLVAEYSPESRGIIARALGDASWTVECAADVGAAQARWYRGGIDLLVADLGPARMLMYLLRDPGPGFDFTNLPHAAVSSPEHGMRAGGFGLLVAGGLVDELVHNSTGNEVCTNQGPRRQAHGSARTQQAIVTLAPLAAPSCPQSERVWRGASLMLPLTGSVIAFTRCLPQAPWLVHGSQLLGSTSPCAGISD